MSGQGIDLSEGEEAGLPSQTTQARLDKRRGSSEPGREAGREGEGWGKEGGESGRQRQERAAERRAERPERLEVGLEKASEQRVK